MPPYDQFFIEGSWVPAIGSERLEVENPATEETITTVRMGSAGDVGAAVSAARRALPGWATTTPEQRKAHLVALRDALGARQQSLAETITADLGCPIRLTTRIQAALPVQVLSDYCDLLDSHRFTETVRNSTIVHEPVGVVAAITPWNYPLYQILCKIAPALAAGCTVVLKPSEVTPLVVWQLFEAVAEAGLPPGVLNFVLGRGPEVGEALVDHPDVDMVSFTGSTAVGRHIGGLCGARVRPVALELGGKSANIILEDADLATAVKVGVANAFLNSGQTCSAWSRMLVPASRYAEAVDMAEAAASRTTVGDPTEETTRMGPVASGPQRKRVVDFIETAVAEGARLITGGTARPADLPTGHYVAPTVLADVDPESTLAQEEVFGPVLAVIPFDDDHHAVAIANNSRYGLAGGVWSADRDRALAVAGRLQAGSIDINGAAYNSRAPFGGYKQSGLGRELGVAGLEEFLQAKAIQQ
ncbi:aldehyde dehydrogenase family protein [Amycolatopsis pithecellobii]|uniref:aldehyde dehydrogenase family protein n=1 Tax=Amycolatopsis pithecellobii TaxID=664692 RepID=UPI0028A9684D|nr:aldehyde dehydrogenase family protein [Amycolatopsis pithecellobii]